MFLIFRPTKMVVTLLCAAVCLHTQPASRKPAPVIGKSLRYCNPLPIEASSQDGSPQGVSLGDVMLLSCAKAIATTCSTPGVVRGYPRTW